MASISSTITVQAGFGRPALLDNCQDPADSGHCHGFTTTGKAIFEFEDGGVMLVDAGRITFTEKVEAKP